jgi:hypothetical protein
MDARNDEVGFALKRSLIRRRRGLSARTPLSGLISYSFNAGRRPWRRGTRTDRAYFQIRLGID